MVQQDFFDNIEFPLPETIKKEYYKITFHTLQEENGEVKYKLIHWQYFEKKQLKRVKIVADPDLILFGNPINIQITKKRDKFD